MSQTIGGEAPRRKGILYFGAKPLNLVRFHFRFDENESEKDIKKKVTSTCWMVGKSEISTGYELYCDVAREWQA